MSLSKAAQYTDIRQKFVIHICTYKMFLSESVLLIAVFRVLAHLSKSNSRTFQWLSRTIRRVYKRRRENRRGFGAKGVELLGRGCPPSRLSGWQCILSSEAFY